MDALGYGRLAQTCATRAHRPGLVFLFLLQGKDHVIHRLGAVHCARLPMVFQKICSSRARIQNINENPIEYSENYYIYIDYDII